MAFMGIRTIVQSILKRVPARLDCLPPCMPPATQNSSPPCLRCKNKETKSLVAPQSQETIKFNVPQAFMDQSPLKTAHCQLLMEPSMVWENAWVPSTPSPLQLFKKDPCALDRRQKWGRPSQGTCAISQPERTLFLYISWEIQLQETNQASLPASEDQTW